MTADDSAATMQPDDIVIALVSGVDDPYPLYAELRERAPQHRLPDGTVVLSRRDDVVAALRDRRFGHRYRERQRELWGEDTVASSRLLSSRQQWFLFMDPPDHGRLRDLVQKVFTPRAFEARAPQIARFVDQHLDGALAAGSFDVVEDFAHPVTVDTIGDLLGVPATDRSRFTEWGLVFEALPGSDRFDEAEALIVEYEDYFAALLNAKRQSPGNDLLSELLAAEADGDRLSSEEALATAFSLFGAGFDTTRHLIGNSVHALLRSDDQADALRRDPELMRTAVEELLRFDGPVQFTQRAALEPVQLGDGETFEAGTGFYLCLGAANRDPRAHAEPDRLDVHRERPAPVTFGGGIHHCLGAAMGRLEARLGLGRLLKRAPRLRADGPAEWRPGPVFRGLERLPVTA